MKQRCAHQVLKCRDLLGGRIDGGQGPIVLELNQRQLSLARLLVYQVVVVLGRYVEAVTLLSVELGGVEDDCDLALEHHEHHRVLVRARHALRTVPLNP